MNDTHPACMPAAGVRVTIHPALDDGLVAAWQRLLAGLDHPSFLHSPHWYRCWLAAYPQQAKVQPLFVLVEQRGDPVAVIPLTYRRTRRLLFPTRTLELMTSFNIRDLSADTQRIKGNELIEALDSLNRSGTLLWDRFRATGVTPESCGYRLLTNAECRRVRQVELGTSNRLNRVDDTSETFCRLSRGWQKTLKKKLARLETLGPIQLQIATSPIDQAQGYGEFLQLEASGWKGDGGTRTSLLHDPPQRELYAALIATSGEPLETAIALLRQNGKTIAAGICLRMGDTLSLMKIAHDEHLQEHSPGNLLIYMLARQLRNDRQIQHLSLVTGLDWHAIWSPESLPVGLCELFADTTGGRLLAALEHTIERGMNIARWLRNRYRRLRARLSVTKD
jgi:CelD/BcsL family acetyltransferase involved in cellulose biosynthesis